MSSILAFSALSIPFLYIPTDFQRDAPQRIAAATFTAEAITCGFPVSGQYGLTAVSLYFLLLPVTVLLRKVTRLSEAIAASVMTYSGVASVHLVVLFAYNNRLAEDAQRNYCERFSIEQSDAAIAICRSTHDPDYIPAGLLVGAGLLTIVPMFEWSSTFKTTKARSILVIWAALLAVGHVFFNLIITNPNINYRICSGGYSEPLPGSSYQAGSWNVDWSVDLDDMLYRNSTRGPRCIYACFARDEYLGRQANEIGVYQASLTNRYVDIVRRGIGVGFWLLYAVLSVVVLALRRRGKIHKQHKIRSQIWSQIRRLLSRLTWFWWVRNMETQSVCLSCLADRIIQGLSVCTYFALVGWGLEEVVHLPAAEPPNAVGQWGVLATAAMVLIAAGVSKLSEAWGNAPAREILDDSEQRPESYQLVPVVHREG
ncbi:uncharacterized protein JN550_002404 [Neoarthrinium moseri]|uniref:uncharacterized protein n=1 Tax=Neoarthrinium moseri TaxID=1658444 RepID=UPI001FDBE0BD|nr:uncharacterized protein JN550_002404 [Neoarthrinium moseri]KAI1874975.1 hypothetical protein JN550_002404 [Neoarthrinium moseri]